MTFTTNLPVPATVAVGSVSDTEAALSWAADPYGFAQWYRIEYYLVSNGKRATSSPTLFAAKHVGTSVTVTGLSSGSNYEIHIYAGRGDSYYEPHGTLTKVQTLGSSMCSYSCSISTFCLFCSRTNGCLQFLFVFK